jgi:acetylornithine/N-succinyldiaminopimelate aminotransferase
MRLSAVQRLEQRYLLPTYDRLPLLLTHGRGPYVFTEDGGRYLDFVSGLGVNALGYAHPAIRKAIAAQAGRLIHVSNLYYHPFQGRLAERLVRLADLDRAFFTNSGTEAWEGALKLAHAYARQRAKGKAPRWRVLAMTNSFHGRTHGSLATTWTEKYRKPFAPLMPGVRFVRFNDVADLRAKFDPTVCAVALEVVQGEGGIRPVDAAFLDAARKLTRASGALLMLDEIQSGLGRTGRPFAYQHFGVRPDIVTLAKPLAGGLPLGAILTTEAVAGCMHPGLHGTTFGGGPLACAAALAFLDVLRQDGLVRSAASLGRYLMSRLSALKRRHAEIRDVRGLGLMVGVELASERSAKSVVEAMMGQRILINRTHGNVLRMLPPLIVTKGHIDAVVDALQQSLLALERGAPSSRENT